MLCVCLCSAQYTLAIHSFLAFFSCARHVVYHDVQRTKNNIEHKQQYNVCSSVCSCTVRIVRPRILCICLPTKRLANVSLENRCPSHQYSDLHPTNTYGAIAMFTSSTLDTIATTAHHYPRWARIIAIIMWMYSGAIGKSSTFILQT